MVGFTGLGHQPKRSVPLCECVHVEDMHMDQWVPFKPFKRISAGTNLFFVETAASIENSELKADIIVAQRLVG